MMRSRILWPSRGICASVAATIVAGALFCLLGTAVADNPPAGDTVGAIEGEAISVEGPMSVEAANGQVRTVLRSGSNVHVKSGQAHINLVEGGQIVICGPAHFSVLKSGKALTIALDSGTIHVNIEHEPALTVYTPQIQARPLSIGSGSQDLLVGLDSAGAMCIRANKGAVRVEQQLTGQSVLVPQSGDVSLVNGQLETLNTSTGRCNCELQQASTPAPPPLNTEVSQLATPEELEKRAAEKKVIPPPAAPSSAPAKPIAPPRSQEPVYQVFMPPLQYDASKKVQTEYDPQLVTLVRRVRVRPTLILQGRVDGEAVVTQVSRTPSSTSAAPPAKPITAPKPNTPTLWERVRAFFRSLW